MPTHSCCRWDTTQDKTSSLRGGHILFSRVRIKSKTLEHEIEMERKKCREISFWLLSGTPANARLRVLQTPLALRQFRWWCLSKSAMAPRTTSAVPSSFMSSMITIPLDTSRSSTIELGEHNDLSNFIHDAIGKATQRREYACVCVCRHKAMH